MFLMGYNLIFTSIPIALYGLLEQNYDKKKLMEQPYLYKLNKNNYLMSRQQFVAWLLVGSCIYYFIILLLVNIIFLNFI